MKGVGGGEVRGAVGLRLSEGSWPGGGADLRWSRG